MTVLRRSVSQPTKKVRRRRRAALYGVRKKSVAGQWSLSSALTVKKAKRFAAAISQTAAAKEPHEKGSKPEPISLKLFKRREHLIPQAILQMPVKAFAARTRATIVSARDDFDSFEGVAFELRDLKFAIMRYEGHPKDTSTVYLPRKLTDVSEITNAVGSIVKSFHLPASVIEWQRKDDPDL